MKVLNKTLEELIKEVKRRYQLVEVEVHEERHSFVVILRARLNSRMLITKALISGRSLPLTIRRTRKKEIVVRKNDLEKRKHKVLRNLLMGAQEVCL